MHTTIERELELKLVLSPERSIPVPARLRYRTDEPYAVHFSFHIGSESPVHWSFSRELLLEGVFRPCGRGDVRVWPTTVNAHNVLCMALSSPDGDALLEAPTVTVAAWLERILRLVPPGSESEMLDLDEDITTLLSGAPDGEFLRAESWSGETSQDTADSHERARGRKHCKPHRFGESPRNRRPPHRPEDRDD